MIPTNRRTFIASGAIALLGACDDGISKRFPITKTDMLKQLLSDEEFALLQNAEARRKEVGDGPLVISERLIGGGDDHHRLDDVSLENIQFDNCVFVGHKMINADLKNIRFNRCAFSALRWERGRWSDLHFTECAFLERDVSILPGNGSSGVSTMERCLFRGSKPPEEKYANETRLYGTFGMGGKSRYVDCEFDRFDIFMDMDIELVSCKLSRADIHLRFEDGARDLLIDNCTVTHDCDMVRMILRSMTLKNSTFAKVDASFVKARSVLLDKVKGCFEFVSCSVDTMQATECVFIASTVEDKSDEVIGLGVGWSDIKTLTLDRCKFEGKFSKILGAGAEPARDKDGKEVAYVDPKTKQVVNPYTEIGSLTLRQTPLVNGYFIYSHIQQLTIEDASFADTKIPHSKIGKLTLKNVKLSGQLDFTNTRVKEVVTENVTKDKLTIIKDKTTEIELSASVADQLPTGLRKWLG